MLDSKRADAKGLKVRRRANAQTEEQRAGQRTNHGENLTNDQHMYETSHTGLASVSEYSPPIMWKNWWPLVCGGGHFQWQHSENCPLTQQLPSAPWVTVSFSSLLWLPGPQLYCFCSLSLLPSALVLGAARSCFQLKKSHCARKLTVHYSRLVQHQMADGQR